MNDEQLESLLRAAGVSAVAPPDLPPKFADHVRIAYSRIRQRTARIKFAVALTGCYAAGILTMWTVSGFAGPGKTDVAEHQLIPSNSAELGADVRPTPYQEQAVAEQVTGPRAAPLQPALVAETSRYELLRQMGDESQRRGDLQAAIAYYGQALDVATRFEQRISYELDNWLLISLKKDRVAAQHSPAQGDTI